MEIGAIILCGGHSTRMGRDKATLPFGPEFLLQRVARLVAEVVPVQRIVVVAANEQVLPELPPDVLVTYDRRPERGPMEGLAAGLQAVPEEVETLYVTSCDVPLLVPAFARVLFARLGRFEIVVPRDEERCHPLAAVYRRSVLGAVRELLAADQLRLRALFDRVPTLAVPVDELRLVDPQLATLRNLNSPADYEAALRSAGLQA